MTKLLYLAFFAFVLELNCVEAHESTQMYFFPIIYVVCPEMGFFLPFLSIAT